VSVSRILGKVVWASIALLAPDIVLSVALHQFLVAVEYRRAVNDFMHPEAKDPGPYWKIIWSWVKCNLKKLWTPGETNESATIVRKMKLKMAFFATMGGFCLQEDTIKGPRLISLKIHYLRRFRAMDMIHSYPLSEIRDKSKASGIAKTVALFQTGWILLQCLGRYLDGLHITLLELNTAVHVVIAIIMYGIWWEKPFDIGRPISLDRAGLGDNSVTAVHVDRLRVQLGKAESKVMVMNLVKNGINLDRRDSKTAVESTSQLSGGSHRVVQATADFAHPKLLAAVAIFRSIGESPTEAVRLFRPVPDVIIEYFRLRTFRDFREGVRQNYRTTVKTVEKSSAGAEGKMETELVPIPEDEQIKIPPDVIHAAYKDAFDVANETAFRVARENVYKVSDGDNKTLKAELETALDEVCKKNRQAAFKAAYRAAFAAAEAGRSLGNADLRDTKATLKGHRKASWVSLKATFRAASAATRAATRHAGRLVALDTALGPYSAADAAALALNKIATGVCKESVRDSIKDDIGAAVNQAREAARNAYREHFEIIPLVLDSKTCVATAADIVARSTATGVYIAAQHAIANAKTTATDEVIKACNAAEKELSDITPAHQQSLMHRLKFTFETAGDVVEDQIIKVPGLFTPLDFREDWVLKITAEIAERQNGEANTAGSGNKEGEANTASAVSENGATGAARSGSKDGATNTASSVSDDGVTGAAGSGSGGGRGNIANPGGKDGMSTAVARTKDGEVQEPKKPFQKKWRRFHRAGLLLFSTIVGALYGVLHLTKWNSARFPTGIEQLLWRISCIVSAAAVVPIGISISVPFVERPYFHFPLIAVCSISWAVFIAARTYIIVESFISLRALPHAAFTTVKWTNAIPHV